MQRLGDSSRSAGLENGTLRVTYLGGIRLRGDRTGRLCIRLHSWWVIVCARGLVGNRWLGRMANGSATGLPRLAGVLV